MNREYSGVLSTPHPTPFLTGSRTTLNGVEMERTRFERKESPISKKTILRNAKRHRVVKPKRVERLSASEIVQQLGGHEKSPGQYMAHCPAHNDNNPSLSISENPDGKILLKCFAGCDFVEIIEELKSRGLNVNNGHKWKKNPGLPNGISSKWDNKNYVAHWTYNNKQGEIVGYVVRYESGAGEKVTIPYFKSEGGKWKAGHLKGQVRPLYNLDKIEQASTDIEIWVVEGEKCADALTGLGLLATTSVGGSQAAGNTDWSPIGNKSIIIWPDKDKAGYEYAANVYKRLLDHGDSTLSVSAIDVDAIDIKEKQDVYDWIVQGHGIKDILNLPRKEVFNYTDIGVIVINQGEIWRAIDEAEALLMKKKPYEIFQQSTRMVRVLQTNTLNLKGKKEDTAGIADVSGGYLLDLLNRNLTFLQQTKEGLKAIDPPAKIANRYLSKAGDWQLNPLSGLIYAPTIKSDGSVLEWPGYDMQSGIYYANPGFNFRPINRDVDKSDADRALRRLRHILQDFPFVTQADESVALAAILTALIRKSIPTAPLFGFNAPVAGSGKTLLANVVSIIATGRQVVTASHSRDKEEERKAVFAKLLQGGPILCIDNIENAIGSEMLNAILTNSEHEGRILGRSEIVKVPTNITFLATGNNLTFQGDMTRRALLCTIDPKIERPESREDFKIPGKLEEHVLKNRSTYVRAALTILKAYANAGYPKQNIPQYGSFEDWSNWVRSALVWLGCEDPNLTRTRIEEDDPMKTAHKSIVNLWNTIYDDNPVRVSEIVRDCNEALSEKSIKADAKNKELSDIQYESSLSDHENLYELGQVFLEVTRSRGKSINGDQIGKWLRQNKGKIQDGYQIIKNPHSPKGMAVEWQLVKI